MKKPVFLFFICLLIIQTVLAQVSFKTVTGLKANYSLLMPDEYYSKTGVGRNDSSGAIADYSLAIEINPKDAVAYFDRGTLKFILQDYSAAISDYTQVIEINPNNASAYGLRGDAKRNLHDYEGAIADYTITIEIGTKIAPAYYGRGLLKILLSQKESGCLDLSKAAELGYQKANEAIKQYCQ